MKDENLLHPSPLILYSVTAGGVYGRIVRTNKRRKAGGYYLTDYELRNTMDEVYESALQLASLEAFGGVYTAAQLDEMVDETAVKEAALRLLVEAQ